MTKREGELLGLLDHLLEQTRSRGYRDPLGHALDWNAAFIAAEVAVRIAKATAPRAPRNLRPPEPIPKRRETTIMTQRETIEPHDGDKRYARRDEKGEFTKDQVDVGKSSATDQRQHAKHTAKPGEGDRGDRKS